MTAGTKVDHCVNVSHAIIANPNIYLISIHGHEIKEIKNQSETFFKKEEKRLNVNNMLAANLFIGIDGRAPSSAVNLFGFFSAAKRESKQTQKQ